MKTIEDHIEKDKSLIQDPTISPAARRHAKEELHELVSLGLTLSSASKYLAKKNNLKKSIIYKMY